MDITKIFPKWNCDDLYCEQCRQMTQRQRGITKNNVKRLFIPQWNSTEMIINVLLIGIVLMGLLYNSETATARQYVQDVESGKLCQDIQLQNTQSMAAWQKLQENNKNIFDKFIINGTTNSSKNISGNS